MSELSDKQRRFTFMVGQLIQFAFNNNMSVRLLCGKCAKEGHHKKGSLHYDGLAVDLALDIYRDGKWGYREDTESYTPLGLFWESIGGSWGGRFSDGNHFSLEHNGMR